MQLGRSKNETIRAFAMEAEGGPPLLFPTRGDFKFIGG